MVQPRGSYLMVRSRAIVGDCSRIVSLGGLVSGACGPVSLAVGWVVGASWYVVVAYYCVDCSTAPVSVKPFSDER